MATANNYKVWVTINQQAIKNNAAVFRNLVGEQVKLWAVVKSNAYGHSLIDFSRLAVQSGVDGFCVDSVIEGLALRKQEIIKPILVLGPTLPHLLPAAADNDITVTVSSFEALDQVIKSKKPVNFHLKIDSGMHRQGFYLEDLQKLITLIRNSKLEIRNSLKGLYTHFASAKDINYPTYTDQQFDYFLKAVEMLKGAGFKNLTCHAAATAGTLINKKYHLDAVRVGIGLYGLWPSAELQTQLSEKYNLQPVLSWMTLVSEVKKIKKGDFIGYDLTERAKKGGEIAILPVGYWHGLFRNLSGLGEVLIRGKRAKILGKVSMDLTVVDVSGINCRWGDPAIIIGQQKSDEIFAADLARQINTSHYEIITRINPLIKRILV